ncbi:MAG: glycerate kinase [Microbacteriaceae bacterium]|nr:glycerate kinase [Microbacteriaceae bacterium]
MTILVAVDKFKGSLSGVELSQAIVDGLQQELGESVQPRVCPIADGGDGTVAAALAAGFTGVKCEVTGAHGKPVAAEYAFDAESGRAVIEVAEACGLRLLVEQRDPLGASTYGVGQLLLHAIDSGAREIIIGLGGTASTDGGAGMLSALGVRFEGAKDPAAVHGGAALAGLKNVDFSDLNPALREVKFIIASDVDNPLTGEQGAAAVYGPQKGATAEQVQQLDGLLANFAEIAEKNLGVVLGKFAQQPGAGAAGGLGFACLAVLGAEMRPGIEVVFEMTGFHRALQGATVVITGEGKFDAQTLHGKGPAGVAAAAREQGAKVFAICGVCELPEKEWREAGFDGVFATADGGISPEQSLQNPASYAREAAARLASHLRTAGLA